MALKFQCKPFSFRLSRVLQTAQGVVEERQGWLLRLEDCAGRCGDEVRLSAAGNGAGGGGLVGCPLRC